MLDVELFGDICYVFALCHFNVAVCGLPVVCYEEDGVGAVKSGCEAGFRV